MDLTVILIVFAVSLLVVGVMFPVIAITLCYDKKERMNGRFFSWIWKSFVGVDREEEQSRNCMPTDDPRENNDDKPITGKASGRIRLRSTNNESTRYVVRVYVRRKNLMPLEDFVLEEICDVKDMMVKVACPRTLAKANVPLNKRGAEQATTQGAVMVTN